MFNLLLIIAASFAALWAMNFLRNLGEFRLAAATSVSGVAHPQVSVLIPARNEESTIAGAVQAALASRDVELEVIVLDDQSTDRTRLIVAELATNDQRVRLEHGRPLPDGWCGKQYACYQLAAEAKYGELLFLDADVRLSNDAIARSVHQRRRLKVDLLSGFPRQIVGTFGEALLIPLVYIILLTFLPFKLMRRSTNPSASAGCGQLFLTTRQAYQTSGGHARIKASLHDGVTLPRAYRQAGLRTDLFDARDIATCRMYRGFLETCRGLIKNAHEGVANGRLIVPASLMLIAGFVFPPALLLYQAVWPRSMAALFATAAAAALAYLPRIVTAYRYDGSWLAACLFPLSVVLFLVLQWYALLARVLGVKPAWRGRSYPVAAS